MMFFFSFIVFVAALHFYRSFPPCLGPHHPSHADTGPHEPCPGGGGAHGQLPHVQHEVWDALAVVVLLFGSLGGGGGGGGRGGCGRVVRVYCDTHSTECLFLPIVLEGATDEAPVAVPGGEGGGGLAALGLLGAAAELDGVDGAAVLLDVGGEGALVSRLATLDIVFYSTKLNPFLNFSSISSASSCHEILWTKWFIGLWTAAVRRGADLCEARATA